MPTSYRPYSPDQALLLPPSLHDWLPEGHLAYFVSEAVEVLDLSALYQLYEGDGRRRQPFEPTMMVKILIYAYATGTFSSRRIARKLEEDVAFRVLAAGNFPAHRTICEFRQLHLATFQQLFVQVVRIAAEAGVVQLGTLVVDGSKVKANASKRKAMSYGRMLEQEQRLREEIDTLIATANAIDAREDAQLGEARGDELPSELHRREERLTKIREAKQRLEQRQRELDTRTRGPQDPDGTGNTKTGPRFKRDFGVPPEKTQDNFTDPESRIMKTTNGFDQCYNAQIAVDETSQLIVATGLTDNGTDHAELLPLLEQAEATLGGRPKQLLADAGYRSEGLLAELERRDIDAYVSLGGEGKARPPASKLVASCRMAAKLATPAGQARYRRRKAIVEPVLGWIKAAVGFRCFSLRGKQKVTAEWNLICLAVNLKRMHALQAV